jgi:hypothetical protein
MDTKFFGFQQLRQRAIESTNKVAFLVECFNTLHSEAPPEDFENLGGRIAGIIKQAGGDYCRVLQIIWKTSADSPAGSHLNYIQRMLSRDQQRNRIDTSDRNKFTKGKYGHMVR